MFLADGFGNIQFSQHDTAGELKFPLFTKGWMRNYDLYWLSVLVQIVKCSWLWWVDHIDRIFYNEELWVMGWCCDSEMWEIIMGWLCNIVMKNAFLVYLLKMIPWQKDCILFQVCKQSKMALPFFQPYMCCSSGNFKQDKNKKLEQCVVCCKLCLLSWGVWMCTCTRACVCLGASPFWQQR